MTQENELTAKQQLDLVLKHIETTKMENVLSLDVEEYTPFACYYVIATCTNMRNLGAMADDIEEFFESVGLEVVGKDGVPESGWIIIQGGDVAVHLFLDVNRKEINLEGFIKQLTRKSDKIYQKSAK